MVVAGGGVMGCEAVWSVQRGGGATPGVIEAERPGGAKGGNRRTASQSSVLADCVQLVSCLRCSTWVIL